MGVGVQNQSLVLVLGAGASYPYGFPTGPELVRDIYSKFRNNFKRLHPGAKPEASAEVSEFVNTLRRSRLDSIDTFLESIPRYRKIGKLAIACALLPLEKGDFPQRDDRGADDWYRHLHNWLRSPQIKNYPRHNVAIITYNYDRSLDFYLGDALLNTYGIPPWASSDNAGFLSAVRRAMLRVPICHVHGQLGFLDWQKTTDGVPFDSRDVDARLKHAEIAAANIKIIYEEEIGQSMELKQAHRILSRASRLVFLGFGYDPVNLERLRLGETLPVGVEIDGTTYCRTKKEMEDIRSVIEGCARADEKKHAIILRNMRNLEFIREEGLFLG